MLYDIESRIDTIKAYLEANLQTKLTAIIAEKGGTIPLPNIQKWYIAELTAVTAYPTGLIIGGRIDSEEQGGNYNKNWFNISVAILVTDASGEQLRRRIYRYIRALAELLYDNQDAMGLNLFLDNASYSPIYARAGGFLADARLGIRVLKYED